MKPIDIRNQPSLPVMRTFLLTINGIRYRLFRSVVTVGVIAVAIAFLMNILSESLIKGAIARTTASRTQASRLAAAWAARLARAGSLEEIITELDTAPATAPVWEEVTHLGGLAASAQPAFTSGVHDAAAYLAFFADLNYSQRRRLVHTASGVGMFDYLRESANRQQFATELATMQSLRFTTSQDAFSEFLGRWPVLRGQLAQVQAGRAAAVAKLNDGLKGRSVMDALTEADGAFGAQVRAAGLSLPPDEATIIAGQALALKARKQLEDTLQLPAMGKKLASHLDILPSDITKSTLWRLIKDRSQAEWFLQTWGEIGQPPAEFQGDRAAAVAKILALAAAYQQERALLEAETLSRGAGTGFAGLGDRMAYLVLVSLLVCVVGIANAMLMSVTERFREIATLKCLGALDGYIMTTFVMEATMLGIVGGIIGGLAGMLIGLARMLASFRGLLLDSLPVGPLAIALGIAIVLGIVLAAVAAVYPSLKAAQLAPMEAMRIE